MQIALERREPRRPEVEVLDGQRETVDRGEESEGGRREQPEAGHHVATVTSLPEHRAGQHAERRHGDEFEPHPRQLPHDDLTDGEIGDDPGMPIVLIDEIRLPATDLDVLRPPQPLVNVPLDDRRDLESHLPPALHPLAGDPPEDLHRDSE